MASVKDTPLYVKAANTDGRVELFERDALHPDGEVSVYGDGRAHRVGRTPNVVALIRSERLVELTPEEADEANQAFADRQVAQRKTALNNLRAQAQMNQLEAQAAGQAMPVTGGTKRTQAAQATPPAAE